MKINIYFVVFLVLMCIAYSNFNQVKLQKKRKLNLAFSLGIVNDCGSSFRSVSRTFKFTFIVNNKSIEGTSGKADDLDCDCLKGNKYIVVYDSLDTENAIILLEFDDFIKNGLVPPKKISCSYDNEFSFNSDTLGLKLIKVNYDSLYKSADSNPAGTIIW
jgi:hypothetical protein